MARRRVLEGCLPMTMTCMPKSEESNKYLSCRVADLIFLRAVEIDTCAGKSCKLFKHSLEEGATQETW